MKCHKLLWVPNLIGYSRILLGICAVICHYYNKANFSLILFAISFAFDGIDGVAARALNQVSAFGAFFDVFADLLTRGLLWVVVNPVLGYLLMSWEWLIFMATRTLYGKYWKTPKNAPNYVNFVMKNNFKTAQGFLAIGSLFLLPSYLYAEQYEVLPMLQHGATVYVLIFSRLLAGVVEFWYAKEFVLALLNED